MDKYEELQDAFERAWYSEGYEAPPRISNAFRWLDEQQRKEMCAQCEYHYKCDTLNAFNLGCLGFVDERRAKEREVSECQYCGLYDYCDISKTYAPVCQGFVRIVEKEGK